MKIEGRKQGIKRIKKISKNELTTMLIQYNNDSP
jgi:hypothetical protein